MSAETQTKNETRSEYNPAAIEPKWQRIWDERKLFSPGDDDTRPKFYNLSMFPYPSGALHCGHVKNYTLPDTISRFRMAKGYSVIQPMGWDAFGLPAENAAIKTGTHPKISTFKHIERMTRQFKQMGYALDWSRELFTCREDYYKWTQWLFTQMMGMKGKSGEPLVYRKKSRVNWCPNDMTVLANEQVVTCSRDGKDYQGCFRCETKVEQRDLEQWCFRITDYADELLDGLKDLEGKWPDMVIAQQREWIGRSEGTNIVFRAELAGKPVELPVFTTRADTAFGVTFMALAPEHPLLHDIIASAAPDKAAALKAFRDGVLAMDAEARNAITKKEGVDTGLRAVNPLNGKPVPVYVGNYVLMYGTGAVMGVPAHDQRDFEFAKAYMLPITQVIQPAAGADSDVMDEFRGLARGECAFTQRGVMMNSADYNGMSSDVGIERMQEKLAASGQGGKHVNFRIRDWGISRQRYWGCPIPVIHCPTCGIVPVPESQLPVTLPEDVEFMPTGRSPLDVHPDFQKVACPSCGHADARRDTDTMDTFVDSSWYYLRYCDPNNSESICDKSKADRWMPVDQYIGGSEHAILHLIYARFINKVMRDLGVVSCDEPFARLFTQGMVLKESIRVKSENYRYITAEEFTEGRSAGKFPEEDLIRRVEKMSKSQLNVVDPEYIVGKFGADTLRAYVLFIGPANQDAVWEDTAVVGVSKFLARWWNELQGWLPLLSGESVDDVAKCSRAGKELRRLSHLYIQKTEADYAGAFGFNTCISKAMETVNFLREQEPALCDNPADRFAVREAFEVLAQCMAPITPHICEEMWQVLGHDKLLPESPWPVFRPELTVQDEIELAVQMNGKLRDTLRISATATREECEAAALKLEAVQRNLEGKQVRKVIVVPGKIVNIVVG